MPCIGRRPALVARLRVAIRYQAHIRLPTRVSIAVTGAKRAPTYPSRAKDFLPARQNRVGNALECS